MLVPARGSDVVPARLLSRVAAVLFCRMEMRKGGENDLRVPFVDVYPNRFRGGQIWVLRLEWNPKTRPPKMGEHPNEK